MAISPAMVEMAMSANLMRRFFMVIPCEPAVDAVRCGSCPRPPPGGLLLFLLRRRRLIEHPDDARLVEGDPDPLVVVDPDDDAVLLGVDRDDRAVDAGGGQHLVVLLERVEHRPALPLLLLLRADEQP